MLGLVACEDVWAWVMFPFVRRPAKPELDKRPEEPTFRLSAAEIMSQLLPQSDGTELVELEDFREKSLWLPYLSNLNSKVSNSSLPN